MNKHVQATPKVPTVALAQAPADIERRMRYETQRYTERQREYARQMRHLSYCLLGLTYAAGLAVGQQTRLWLIQWIALGGLAAVSIYQMLKVLSRAREQRTRPRAALIMRGVVVGREAETPIVADEV